MALRTAFRYRVYQARGALGALGVFGKLNPPILLVGSPNSGTQVLGRAIAMHPAIGNRSEARLLWDKDFHKRDNDTLKTADDVRPEDRRRLRGTFCYYQWHSGRPIVLNRHPENSLRIHFMKRIFPEAKLIHIVRDGRAAVCSNYRSAKRKTERRENPFGAYLRPAGWRGYLDRPVLEQLAYMWNEPATAAPRSAATIAARNVRRSAGKTLSARICGRRAGAAILTVRCWSSSPTCGTSPRRPRRGLQQLSQRET